MVDGLGTWEWEWADIENSIEKYSDDGDVGCVWVIGC